MTRTARITLMVAVSAMLSPLSLIGQWSMDFPGVPTARVPFLSGGDGRFELDVTGYRLQQEAADTIAGSLRIGFGNSWRIASRFELGYDVSLGELRLIRPTEGSVSPAPDQHIGGTGVYGMRLGLKFQPYSIVDPDGYGVAAAFGVSYQPELQPVFSYAKEGEDVTTGGYAGSRPPDGELETVLTATQAAMASVSFRVSWLDVDAAVTHSRALPTSGQPLKPAYTGTWLSGGARLYLTSSFGVGAAYWGSGAPPWRDRLGVQVRPETSPEFGFLLTFGANIDGGTDLMVYSPTGDFSESVSLYLRAR